MEMLSDSAAFDDWSGPLKGKSMRPLCFGSLARLAICCTVIFGPALDAFADATSSSPMIEEIVVTAQKRSQSALDVPISLTALSADTIKRANITQFIDYAIKVPNLSFGYANGQGVTESRSIAIRGIQGGGTTGFYIDDLPVPEGLDPQALDLARIEVLRGPQGTLYGARSMGGTIRLITQVPNSTSFSGTAHALISAMDAGGPGYQTDASANVPLGSHLAARVSGFSLTRGGWENRQFPDARDPAVTDTVSHVGRQDMNGGTASLLWTPSDALSIRPMVMYQSSHMNGLPLADKSASNNIQLRLFNIPEVAEDEWTIEGMGVTYHSPVGDIVSATSYFNRRVYENEEASDWTASALGYSPPLPAAIQTWPNEREFAQELRFASAFNGALQLTAGLFYQNSTTYFNQNFVVPGANAATGGALGTDLLYYTDNPYFTKDKAAFGEISYAFMKEWKAIVGLRYSEDDQRFTRRSDGVFNGGSSYNSASASQTAVTPKFAIKFQPSEDLDVYALAAKGFRPGGPNGPIPEVYCGSEVAALGLTLAGIRSYNSDSLWNYEAGAKMRLLDRRLNINTAAFWIDWKNIQQVERLLCGFNFSGNAGSARSRGGEVELSAIPLRGLSMTLGVGYTDAVITASAPGVSAKVGDPIQQVAPWTGSFATEYDFPLAAGIQGITRFDFSYVDHSFSAANDQLHPRLRQSYYLLNLRAGVSKGRWEIAAFTENVTNSRPNLSDNQSQAAELAGRPRILTLPPRTIGLDARVRF